MRRAILAACLLTAAACAKSPPAAGELAAQGVPEPFALPDLAGKTVKLADFKGKVVLLDFWATWCPPCVEETPDLVQMHKELESQGFTVVGVAIEEASQADVAGFVKAKQVPYPILYAEERPAGYKLHALPTAYLIDREGRVRQRYLGMKDIAEVRRDVEAVLKEESVPKGAAGS